MLWFIEVILVEDRSQNAFFGLFADKEEAEEYVARCFNPAEVDVRYNQMVPVNADGPTEEA